MTVASITSTTDDRDYERFLQRLPNRLAASSGPLFTTDVDDLYTLFLDALPASERQYHNCHACRSFVTIYGALVAINTDGTTQSALWHEDDAPELYQASVRAMLRAIKRAKVTGVFYSNKAVWGTPVTGVWHHLAVTPMSQMIFSRLTQTPGQARAERREEYSTLLRALADFTPEVLRTAINLLRYNQMVASLGIFKRSRPSQCRHSRRLHKQ